MSIVSGGHHMLFAWIPNNRRGTLRRRCAMPADARCVSADSSAIGYRRTGASKDLDIEVFGIPQEQLLPLLRSLGRVEPVGQAFPVYKLGDIDVALPRRESKTGRGHKGFTVEGDPSMPFEEAARRRDFTINAIGWDPLTDEYLDPFDGRKDLDLRVLRVVDPATFADDSLRVLRALQFAARFELTLDPETARICSAIALDDLPAERIWGEFEKLLLQAERPSIGFALARELGVIHQLLPEMEALYDCPQDPEWHPEGNVWIHTLMVIDKARELNGDLDRPRLATIMLGAVCHDLGKPVTTAVIDGRIKSPNHEAMGVEPATTDPRSPEHQHARRLRRARAGDRPRRRTPAADGVLQGARDGDRRRVPPAGAEGRSRIAGRASRERIATAARACSTAPASTGSSSAPARSASSTSRRRRSCSDGT